MPSPDDRPPPVLTASVNPGEGTFLIDRHADQPLGDDARTWIFTVLAADGIVAEPTATGLLVQLDDWERTDTVLAGIAELVLEWPWDDDGELRA